MKVHASAIPDVLILEPKVFHDERGFFLETWERRNYEKAGIPADFVQDNHSFSAEGVLRGLHYQIGHPQGKLVRVTAGEVFDVAVDLRRRSPTFGRWVSFNLNGDNKRQIWIPPGFAHGFYVIKGPAEFQYKCSEYYAPSQERCLLWSDPALEIDWPLPPGVRPSLSQKDSNGIHLAQAEVYW
ncbi:MAG: dTDP-4-dehydrorhamnose 3,5-epimerase [Oleiphilaceae bacterium]|nr:dTDP-4-dehydrorhamnose 3,5-epimerase [Oleiphilaceae bacterium]